MGIVEKRVGLFGLFGIGNIGNDGSLESMVRFLQWKAPQERLLCICGGPAAVEKAFGLDSVPIYPKSRRWIGGRAGSLVQRAAGRALLWPHAARHLRGLKALIVPGMGVLDDFSVSPLGWPHDILCWCLLGRLMGVKVIFASVGAGPIEHPISRWLMKAAAGAAHYRSYRDTMSKTFMESIGLDARNDSIYPDIAFRLPAPAVTRRDRKGGALTIGVGVMAYHGWRATPTGRTGIYATYIEKMTGFVVWLLERGHTVRLLMGDEADRRAVDDLLRSVRAEGANRAGTSVLFAPASTLCDVMEQMGGTDIAVTTRYHNLIAALKMATPTISIGYSKKNDVLMRDFGLSDYCQDIDRLDIKALKVQVVHLILNRLAIGQHIERVLSNFEARLGQQEDILTSLFLHGAGRPVSASPGLPDRWTSEALPHD